MPSLFEVNKLMHQVMSGQLSRRDFVKRLTALGFTVPAISAFLAACGDSNTSAPPTAAAGGTTPPSGTETTSATAGETPSASDSGNAASQGEGKRGGVLKVALNTDLASADIMWGSPDINRDVMGHVYEYLYTMSEGNDYIPDLAEGDMEVSTDGKEFTIKLRQGVTFHNGKEMTSADVVASLERWRRMTSRGQAILENLASLTRPDDYTVKFTFTEPNGGLLFALGHYGGLAVVLPAEIVEKYYDPVSNEDKEIAEQDAIGTGPYKLQQWVRDSVITLVRNENYTPREEPSDGRGGKRHAYVDEIHLIPVPDANTRLNGLISGEYHLSYSVAPAQYEQVAGDPNLTAFIIKPGSKAVAVFNKKLGPFTDQRLRQAALAATDPFEVMAGAVDDDQFYACFASLAGPEWSFWYTEVGKELYETRDLDRAKRLLEESGYSGEKLRWITTRDFDYMYRTALVASEQWAEAGFNIELIVSDWPTVVSNRSKPEEYEIFSTGIGFAGDPLGTSAYRPDWPGWTTSPGVTGAAEALITETDPAKRKKLWEDLQRAFYEEVPYIQFGELYTFRAARTEVKNFSSRSDLMLWNVWLDQ